MIWDVLDFIAVFPSSLQISFVGFLLACAHCTTALFVSRYLLNSYLCFSHCDAHWEPAEVLNKLVEITSQQEGTLNIK